MNEMLENSNRLIAFVSNSAWSVYNFRLDVIRHLIQSGYRVMVIAPDDEFSQLLRSEGCEYHPIVFDNRSENPLNDWHLYLSLKKAYRQFRPDLIFHYVIKPNIYGSLAAANASINSIAVVTGLGYSFARKNWLYFLTKALYKRALKRTQEVWFLNNEDAKKFVNERIVNIIKTKVLPGEGVNTNFFSPVLRQSSLIRQEFTFLMSTRMLRSKGVRVYAEAARIVKNRKSGPQFQLIGFFENHHPDSIAEEEILGWQREGIIQYGGFAKDVRVYLQKADCFVFPSFYNEGVPRCLLEAASMELPIITSLNRGCKEVVIEGSNGFLCNLNDPFDVADKMEKMISLSPEERRKMGENGRALVTGKFNVSQIIAEYERTIAKY